MHLTIEYRIAMAQRADRQRQAEQSAISRRQIMSARANITDDGRGMVPVACTLTPADLAVQGGRWERLAAWALTERAETVHGLRLSFHPGPGTEEELRQLAAVENECCRWASWTVQTRGEHLVLDIRSAGEGIAALHSMFTSLRQAPASSAHSG